MRRYHVTTFGCQMNAHDSERIKGMLEELGLGEAPVQQEADVIVFNTCTIREKPDQRFAAHLAQARALKARDPEKVIGTPGSPSDLKARGDRIVAAYEQTIVRPVERLKAPPEIASQAAQLRELARRQLNVLQGLTVAGKAGDLRRVQRLASINQQLNEQAAQVARDLKARSCTS